MSEARLVEIETRLAYQEDHLDELNKIVIKQQTKIDELTEACRVLIDRFNELSESGSADGVGSDEAPPHY